MHYLAVVIYTSIQPMIFQFMELHTKTLGNTHSVIVTIEDKDG